jgi:DNA adenine methylase
LLTHGHDPELKRRIVKILERKEREVVITQPGPELPFPKTRIIKSVKQGGPKGFIPERATKKSPWRDPSLGQVTKRLGSKREVMPLFDRDDEPLIPRKRFKTYVDMFGGGLSPLAYMVLTGRVGPETEIIISEMDTDTFEVYEAIRKNPGGLVSILKSFKKDPEKYSYTKLTAEYNMDKDLKVNRGLTYRAARWVQMGAYCFGSTLRRNRHGRINVICHRDGDQSVFDEKNILAMSVVLQNATLINGDFSKCLDFIPENANSDTFVYADPPYHGQETTKEYGVEDFTEADQRRLAEIFFKLQKRGIKMAVSNADTPLIRKIYSGAQCVSQVVVADKGKSQHGEKGAKRHEVLATNYKLPWMKKTLL